MTTSQNISQVQSEHESEHTMGAIQRNVTLVTQRLITYILGREWVTLRSERGTRLLPLPQKMVESAPRGAQPFDSDVYRAPPGLDFGLPQFGHRVGKIQRSAISEAQPRPSHARHDTPYRASLADQISDAAGCAFSMAGILLAAVVTWLVIFALFALVTQ